MCSGSAAGWIRKYARHVPRGEFLAGLSIHGQGWRDIDQASPLYVGRVIEQHPVRHAGAAIVRRNQETLVTEVAHHIDLILRHGAE